MKSGSNPPAGTPQPRLRFLGWELDATTLELRRAGVLVPLPRQPAALLLLARQPGALVTREEIRQALWPERRHGFEGALNACVRQVRAALGDEAAAPRYIATLPRRGYRFVAPLELPPPVERSLPSPRRHWGSRLAAAVLVALALAGGHDYAPTPGRRRVEPAPAALLAWQKALYLVRQRDPGAALRSRRALERVIALDPGFAPAYAALARERLVSGDRAAARRLALQAEDRDPGLAAAHAVLGELALVEDWDVETAEARLRRAVRLEPEEPAHRIALGFVLAVSGRPEPAVHEVHRALEADPVGAALRHDAGLVLYWSRRYDEALQQCDLVSELEPERWWAEDCSIDALVRLGRASAAAERVAGLLRGWDVDPSALGWRHDHSAEQRLRLYREWRLRRREAKRADTHPPLDFEIATLHAELGNPAAALDALSRAASRRSQAFVAAAAEPRFDALRGEPRFRALIAPLARPGQPARSRRAT